MLYDEARYLYRGKVAESHFEKNCLTEYGEVFKTVCVDGAYAESSIIMDNLSPHKSDSTLALITHAGT